MSENLGTVSISIPVSPYMASVLRNQFRKDTLFSEKRLSEAEQAIVDTFLAGVASDTLQIRGAHSSTVVASLLAYLLDFETPDGFEAWREDIFEKSSPINMEWESMSQAGRDRVIAEAAAIGATVRGAWQELTENDS